MSALAEAHAISSSVVSGRDPRETVAAVREAADQVREQSRPRFLDVQSGAWVGNQTFYPTDVTGPTDLRRAAAPTGSDWDDRDDPILAEARSLLADDVPMDALLEVDAEVSRRIERATAEARELAEAPGTLAEVATSGVWSGS